MELKKVILKDGSYTCDVGISVDEWMDILNDDSLTNDNYAEVLVRFYREHEHKATCKQLGERYGDSPHSFNAKIVAFAKAVQKRLARFEITGTDGAPTYWIIPMIGKTVGEHFEWTLRPELVEAIEKSGFIEKYSITFNDLAHLVEMVNQSLGNFCDTFRYKRKELISGGRASTRGLLFKYEDKSRDWAINEGGGVEVQYHIFYRDDTVGYGIGFNTQYVPFANDLSTVEYMQPFANGYLKFKDSDLVNRLRQNKFHFIFGSEKGLEGLKHNEYHLFGRELSAEHKTLCRFDYQEMINQIKGELFELYCQIFENRNSFMNNKDTNNEYVELLKNNHNLILTGAPGTGKTYLARQIALNMLFNKMSEDELTEDEKRIFKDHYCFVQFHPSYDYTDFVEGLRAEELNGQVAFNLHNGTFKAFCKKAVKGSNVDNFEEEYKKFIDDLIEQGGLELETPTLKRKFRVEINSRKTCVAIPATDVGTRMSITKSVISNYMRHGKVDDWKPYTVAICNYFTSKYPVNTVQQTYDKYPYIFVIDEINRGEISKIFGELFFAIDPGYRGTDGKVFTQYANIQEGDTVFDDELGVGWFYVPKNVYIIGTMNDIDRSVESMDFAMRRRFAWEEIKSIDRVSMWDGKIDKWKETAAKKMEALNKVIESIQGLSSAYHIGPAYFLKLAIYDGDFDKLWNNHLHGILFEYLRGMPDAATQMVKLEEAYKQL